MQGINGVGTRLLGMLVPKLEAQACSYKFKTACACVGGWRDWRQCYSNCQYTTCYACGSGGTTRC